jgi:hypothetical protein
MTVAAKEKGQPLSQDGWPFLVLSAAEPLQAEGGSLNCLCCYALANIKNGYSLL